MHRRPVPSSSQAQLYELNKQVEEKRKALLLASHQDQSDTLAHYKNFGLGGHSSDQSDIQDFLKKQPNRPTLAPYLQADPRSIPLSSNISFSKPDSRTFASVGRDMLFGQQASTPSSKMSAFQQSALLAAPSAQQPATKYQTERDRRLRLRELERQRQKTGGSGSIYGVVEDLPPSQPAPAPKMPLNHSASHTQGQGEAQFQSFAQPALPSGFSFPEKRQSDLSTEGSRKSRREELWELKKQKRMSSLGAEEGASQAMQGGMNIQENYAEKTQRRPPLIPPSAKAPNSPPKRPISAIQKARQLDKEINHGQGQPQSPPSGIFQFPGERYEENRRKMQEQIANEYKQFSAARANSVGRRDSKHLQGQGASLPGFNNKTAEEKSRAQEEYRKELIEQQQARKQSAGIERRQQMADDVFTEIMHSRGSHRPPSNDFQRPAQPQQPQRLEFQAPQIMVPPVSNVPQFSQQQMTLDQIQQRKRELVTQINPSLHSNVMGSSSQRSLQFQPPQQPPMIRNPQFSEAATGQYRNEQELQEQEVWPSKITTVQLPPEELKKRNQQKDEYRAYLEKQMKEKEEKKAREEAIRKAQEEKEEREAVILQERMKQQREMELGRAVPQQPQAPTITQQRNERPKQAAQIDEFRNQPAVSRTEPQSANFVRFKVENMKDEVELSKREEKARKQKIWQEELRKQMEERDREKKQRERAQKEEEERLERKLEKERVLLEKQQAYELRVEKWKNAVKRKEQGEDVGDQELEEPSPPSELYIPAKVTRKNNQMFMTSQQIEQQRQQQQKEQWSAPTLPPQQPIQFTRARDPAQAEDPFARQEQQNLEQKAGFHVGQPKASREDLFSPPATENQNIMNMVPMRQPAPQYLGGQGGGRQDQLSEVERMRYETEMKLLMQEKQKLEEQMMWKQREQQMRDQMFQMMVMMQAGGKVDPQELMKQYFIIQQQMNPNAVPSLPPQPQTIQQPEPQLKQPQPVSFQPAQSLGYSESQRSLTGSRGRIPTLDNRMLPEFGKERHQFQEPTEPKEVFQVQTQFHQLPQILHQGGALPQPTDRSDYTLPQSNTFIPHSEMPSVNSSAFQAHNMHTKLEPQELEKSLTSETKLIAAVASTEGRLRKKLKELQNQPDSAMINSAMMSETWVPTDKRMDMRQDDQITENSNDKFDTFRQNMKDINEQMDRLDQNLQKKQSETASYQDRESIKTESGKSGTGTFNFQNTGQYSPMSTDKRQTFYDQIKSLELTESQLPGAKQDVTVVSEAPPADESYTDYAESSYIQKNMREIQERVENELRQEGFVKNAKIVKTPTLSNIGEAEGLYVKEMKNQEEGTQEKPKIIRKSWSKQGVEKNSKEEEEEREGNPEEVKMSEEVKNEARKVAGPDASGNLE